MTILIYGHPMISDGDEQVEVAAGGEVGEEDEQVKFQVPETCQR